MKVILNVDAITHPLTGIGHYTLALGQQLPQLDGIEQVRYFSANRWVEDLQRSAEHNQWLAKLRRWVPFKAWALKAYAKHRASHFKQLTLGLENHVFHSPNFILMPFSGHAVATFHDLSFVHFRATQPAYRLNFLDREISRTLAQANTLITPSAFVKQEIINQYGFSADNIHVTPLGVSAGFKPYTANEVQSSLSAHKLRYKSFILSVATTEPRKNLRRLLDAYGQLPHQLRNAYPLVLVGSSGWLNQKLNQKVKALVNQGQVISLGYLGQQQLQHLYAAAKLTAFPSLYEGFGLPIIESMAAGTPVLTSAHSAMQEVAGGVAKLCNPLDVASIKSGLIAAIEDDQWLQQSTEQGIVYSADFSWRACAEKTMSAYRSQQ